VQLSVRPISAAVLKPPLKNISLGGVLEVSFVSRVHLYFFSELSICSLVCLDADGLRFIA
jgi:hypothetical protein